MPLDCCGFLAVASRAKTQVVLSFASIGLSAFALATTVGTARAEGPEPEFFVRSDHAEEEQRHLQVAHLQSLEAARLERQAQLERNRKKIRELSERRELLERVADFRPLIDSLTRDKKIEVADARLEDPAHPIIVDVDARELHFYSPAGIRLTFPVATALPEMQEYGVMSITKKRDLPIWIPTPSQRERDPTLPRAVLPGPDNPLGTRALNLSRGYLRIHGTNEPHTVGQAVSDGCIRLSNIHVELLYELIDVGMKVEIR